MKTLIIFICISLTRLSTSTNKASDFRDPYCGTYSCKSIYRHLTVQKTSFTQDTLGTTLTVSKNQADSVLNLAVGNDIFYVKLDDHRFRGTKARCFGHFSNDSIYFTFIPSLGPQSFRFVGKK